MLRTDHRPGPAVTLALGALLAVVPACSASAGLGLFRGRAAGTDPTGTVVYRPAYPNPRTKVLYLSNYAGSNYPPLGAGPVLNPTGYSLKTGRPKFACPDGTWGGR